MRGVIRTAALACGLGGFGLWLAGWENAGLAVVIGCYVLYVAARLLPRRARKEPEPGPAQAPATRDTPWSWESLHRKAVEALVRTLDGQKIEVSSFFHETYADFPALVKVYRDLDCAAPELALRTDLEVLKLNLDPVRTEEVLTQIAPRVRTAEDIAREIGQIKSGQADKDS